MSPKNLLIVTTAFPYGKGESFVAAELEHIAAYFGSVEVVPSYYTPGTQPRAVKQDVNLDYAARRWGVLRTFHVAFSFVVALKNYSWRADLVRVLRQDHKYDNCKELARALYRAQLFESFLRRQVARHGKQFDLVYFYWMMPEIMGALGFRKATGSPLKIVARAHGGDLYEERKSGGYAGLRNDIAGGIDDIYCISDHGRAYLDGRYPAMSEKFHTARLGVEDPGRLNQQPREAHLSILSCSFVVAGKRLHLVVEAIEHMLHNDPSLKIRWTHIGNGELYDELRALVADKLGGRAEVVFKGYLAQQQITALYQDEGFDVVVNVSDCEGIPVSLMEASAAGIPMVATDVGGNSEIVNAGNGVLIAADADIPTIAAALLHFADRTASAAHRRAARSDWDQRFNARRNYALFGQQLAKLAGSD
jgi:colanic acid/amylovoran biosynthesis glycosyltransferase